MEHEEYYFRWHEAVALFDIRGETTPKGESVGGGDQEPDVGAPCCLISANGILHICGNGIFFEPHDVTLPILRACFKYIGRLTPWQANGAERDRLRSFGVSLEDGEAKERDPQGTPRASLRGWIGQIFGKLATSRSSEDAGLWETVWLEATQVATLCCHRSNHPCTKVDAFGPIFLAVKPDPMNARLERPVVEFLSILLAIHVQSSPSESSSLLQSEIVSHEVRELAHLPALSPGEVPVCRGRAVQVEALVFVPGRFLLTNHSVYFKGFHQRRHDPELVIALPSLFRVARRRHMFQDTGLELTERKGTTHLFIFSSIDDCRLVWRHLSSRPSLNKPEHDEWEGIVKAWQMGGISTFHYLIHLNNMADRSFHDIAQYPVMPWVISDYTSEQLDLSAKGTFRDLSQPIGALQPERIAELLKRYDAMDEPRYLYATHYSTPAYVVYFLVRSAPLLALRFHGGKFDNADRSFSSVESTWRTCLHNPADVKELIPAFYNSNPSFLLNSHQLALGVK